ncbi:MAG: hypothetical protein ACOC5K_00315 [Chloroflexota bacterium]
MRPIVRNALIAGGSLVALLMAACSEGSFADSEGFHTVMSWDDGRYATLSGVPAGHAAGEPTGFVVTIGNGSDAAWEGEYCLLLVGDAGALAHLGDADFDLAPGAGATDSVSMEMPAGADDESYGLSLVLPGQGSVTNTIHTGDAPAVEPAPWGSPGGCVVGPLGQMEHTVDRSALEVDGGPVREAGD